MTAELPIIQITHEEQWIQLKDNLKVFVLKRAGEINFQVRNHPLGNQCIATFNQEQKAVIARGLFGIELCVLDIRYGNDPNDLSATPFRKSILTTKDRKMLNLFVKESGFLNIDNWLTALTEEFLPIFPNNTKQMIFQIFELTDIMKAIADKGERMEGIEAEFDNQTAIESGYYRLEHDKYPELCYAVDCHEAHELVKLISIQFGLDFKVGYGLGTIEQPLEYAETTGTCDPKKREVHLLEFPLIIEIIHELAHYYAYIKFGTRKHDEAHSKAVEEIVTFIKPHLKPAIPEIQEKRRVKVMESANRLGLVPAKK